MVRHRKAFRKIKDKHFLKISDMPLIENRSLVFEWLKTSVVMEYVFKQSKNWGFIVSEQLSNGSYVWQGINFDSEIRSIERESKSKYGEKIIDALIKDEIDLMPPLVHKYPKETYSVEKSEVINFLSKKKNVMNLVFITAAHNGLIKLYKDGSWIGINNYTEKEGGN